LLQSAILAEQQSANEKEKFKKANTPSRKGGFATTPKFTSSSKGKRPTVRKDKASAENLMDFDDLDEEEEEEDEEEEEEDEEEEENVENLMEDEKDNDKPRRKLRLASREPFIDSPESVGLVDSFSPGARTVPIHPESVSMSAKRRSSRGLRFSLDNVEPDVTDAQTPSEERVTGDKEEALSKALDSLEKMERKGVTDDAVHLRVMKAAADLGLLSPAKVGSSDEDDGEGDEDDEGFVTGNEEDEDEECEEGRERSNSSP
jgi:hypothetical protein